MTQGFSADDKAQGNDPVLVFGATGKQGGAVARALTKQGRAVRALVRDPQSPEAEKLAAAGVQLFPGGFDDISQMREALVGAGGVFSVQPNSGSASSDISDDDEVRYGKRVVDLAVEAGVRHLVYSSANILGRGRTGLPNLDCKLEIEDYVRRSDIASTIVRPSSFMELLTLPGMGLNTGVFTFFVGSDQPVELIASEDIGRIVAAIFAAGDKYAGQTVPIAGDEVTGAQIGEALSDAAGQTIAYQKFPDSVLAENRFLALNAALFDEGRGAGTSDIKGLEKTFGKSLTLHEWLNGPGKPLLDAALKANADGIAMR